MKRKLAAALLLGGLALAGCGDSIDEVTALRGEQGNGLPQAPVAVGDFYATEEDTPFTLNGAQGVLRNDSVNVSSGTLVRVNFPSATSEGGAITNKGNDGSFTYTPPLGFVGRDSFVYTVSNGYGTARAVVTIDVEAPALAP